MISERKEKQFDESQYEILIKCSDKGDLTEWNEWIRHSGKIYAGYSDITFFNEPNRYSIK